MSEPVKNVEEKEDKEKVPVEAKEGEVAKKEEDYESEDSLFSLRRPKDIREGFGSGVGNILKGTLGGAALLVTAPIKGAYDGGHSEGSWGAMKGFGAGLGLGVVGGVSMMVGGAVTGVVQIGRGIYHTPGSVSAMSSGKEWDDERREWYIYNLEEEAKSVLTVSEEDFLKTLKPDPSASTKEAGADGADGVREARKVVDTEFYDALGVQSNASAADIKKAYYKKARDNHPDRHPNDPEAHEKFQVIGHAYQILSDETLRANYDASGKDSVDAAPKVDPSTLFAMIFGSEKFVPLVGELKLASQMQAEESEVSVPKLKKFRQKKREVQCAVNLVQKIQPYLDLNEDVEAFKATIAEELKELSASPFGSTLVGTIGLAYYEAAVAEMSTMEGLSVSLTQAGRSVTTGLNIASEGVQAAMIANEVNKAQKLKKLKEEQKTAAASAGGASGASGTGNATADAKSAAAAAASVDAKDSKDAKADTPSTAHPTTGAAAAAPAPVDDSAETAAQEAAMKEKVERLSGHMFAVMWYFTDIDIRSTLASVCFKVLRDHSQPAEVLQKRAKALKILGDCFIAKGGSMAAGLGDVRSRLHSQMNGGEDKGEGKEEKGEGKEGKEEKDHSAQPAASVSTGNIHVEVPLFTPEPAAAPAAAAATSSSTQEASDTLD